MASDRKLSQRRVHIALIFIVACFSSLAAVLADNFKWVGLDGGMWAVLANWEQNGGAAIRLPGPGDDIVIDMGDTNKVVLLGSAVSVKSLSVKNATFKPTANQFDIVITTTNNMTFDPRSAVQANPGGPGHRLGGKIKLQSLMADLDIKAKLTAGNGDGLGNGGNIELSAQTSIQIDGIIQAGDGG